MLDAATSALEESMAKQRLLSLRMDALLGPESPAPVRSGGKVLGLVRGVTRRMEKGPAKAGKAKGTGPDLPRLAVLLDRQFLCRWACA